MHIPQIITSLLVQDLYKLSMGQAIYHQFPSYTTTWTFKCRNKGVRFTQDMLGEIYAQLILYSNLRFTDDELEYLSKIKWLKPDYIEFLRLWKPRFEDFKLALDDDGMLHIEATGTWLNTSMYEVPVLAIVNEVYFRMHYNGQGTLTFDELMASFETRLKQKYDSLTTGHLHISKFSEFGLRRRLSGEAQDLAVRTLARLNHEPLCTSTFVGTSNVFLARKHGLTPVGTMAHEFIMCVGQGNHRHNPAYSNYYALSAWVKEYGVLNGIALTDTTTTDNFLKDFDVTFGTLFSGVRHDSGDPIEWGEKMLSHYLDLGISPENKTLLFSDSLDFKTADKIARHFQGQCQTAFGIGTYISNDTPEPALNIVMKVTKCNGQDVAKISDAPGKSMCKNPDYVDYLLRCINWRAEHE